MATQALKIFGPNLNSVGQVKGMFHVHTAECGDCKKYGPGTKFGGDNNGMPLDTVSARDVCAFIYADMLEVQYGTPEADAQLDEWLSDFYFAPCVWLEPQP